MGEAGSRGTFEQRRDAAIMKQKQQVAVVGPGGRPQQVELNLGADTLETKCKKCGGDLFSLVYRHRTLPSISIKNPTGDDVPIKVETFVCIECRQELGVPFEGPSPYRNVEPEVGEEG